MLPSILARQVRSGVEDQLRSSFSPSTEGFRGLVDRFLSEPESLSKGPWLSLDMPFRRSDRDGEYFPAIPLGFKPYKHQGRAFERLSGSRLRSTLVATGTGSGKTECFLLPILDGCIRARPAKGIKAILVYPMNALATDQARRIAKLVANNPALTGLRVGIYADERPKTPSTEMTRDGVIDSREVLIGDPPDILLTNYKMLDYMLIRPDEREIWTQNGPDTLRYLVVDELHTFDGAQGTDLASLVRRLKSRLGMRRGDLCCVGTSATLGGPESLDDLIAYASEIFDEPFDHGSVILEDRTTVMEYLQPLQVSSFDVPKESEVMGIVRAMDDLEPLELLRRSYRAWFGDDPSSDLSEASERFAVGEMIDGHLFFQNLLKVMQGRPTSYVAIRAGLRGNRLYRGFSDDYLDALVDTLTALIAHARRLPEGTDSKSPVPQPFFSVRHQLWVRELRRMVASLETTPILRHYDDLGLEEQRRTLPVVHCRSCGGAGWATALANDERRPVCAEPKEVYQAYFGYSDRLRFIFREPPADRTRKAVGQTRHVWLCTKCLVPTDADERPEKGCTSCQAEPDALVRTYIHKPGRFTSEKFRVDHDCPFCASPSGMGILGAQAVTLVSGMAGTIFGSDHNDDPKLLTFSDSVQDAAHRAAVLQARNATNVFRAGLARYVCEKVDSTLETLFDAVPASLRGALGPEKHADDYVATYLPADMEWRRDYLALLADDSLAPNSPLPSYLDERMSWEAFAELTFRSRLGATVERAGLVAPHVDPEAIGRTVRAFMARMTDEAAIPSHLTEVDVEHFVIGVLDHMRARGAVVNDVTRMFVQHDANWYAVTKAHPSGKSLPQYAPSAPRPTFPTNRSLKGFESFSTDDVGNWYVKWFQKCFDLQLTLTGSLHREAYELLFRLLEHESVVSRLAIGARDSVGSAAWGLTPRTVRAYAETAVVRCDRCGNDHHVPASLVTAWSGMSCTRIGCGGHLRPTSVDRGRHRASRLTKGRIKRILAAEHTSLLDREERLRVESRFMTDSPRTWYPNLLSATPTLEMGINIGDLSTLVLCSVPPEQQNYVQRIGRTGRRDGNSLNVTVANGRPHDMWYWTDPQEMISGKVKTPGVHLKAVAILRRQFAAFTLDRWVKEQGAGARGHGRVGEALKAIANASKPKNAGNRGQFPLYWYDFVGQNAERLFEEFCGLFRGVRDDAETASILHDFAVGSATEGLGHLVASEFADVAQEVTSLQQRVSACTNMETKLKAAVPPPLDLDDRVKALKAEKLALARIRDGIRDGDNLGLLTDRGVLPNYAFPEQGVTLKSVLYQSDTEDGQKGDASVTEYLRPAAAALAEFAPSSAFYVEGKKLKVDQIDLSASPIQHWRVCPDCTHMELAEIEKTEAPCPCCGSEMWADVGSRRPMIRLKQVFAVGTERGARIGDDADDRDRRFFDRDYLPSFDRDQVGNAYAVENAVLPFAYEHLRRCTFREVNFGEKGEAPTGQKVAGDRRYGHGFRMCRSCGKVQDPRALRFERRNGSNLGVHAPRCQEVKSEDDATYVSVVYLYREFTSEAIRMLLPLAKSSDADAVKSLRAAIDLGLRLHFKGKVDHLRSTLVETKEGPLSRRHLYVYDTVPGGTGYLKQLANNPDEFKDVFATSLAHMRDCVCNGDPKKDGCPRCLRSHAATFGHGEISRDLASGLLSEILAGWGSLHAISTVNEIKLNKALESELEQMFLIRFQDAVKAAGGKFAKTVISGKPGFLVTMDKGEWRLEQQVDLHGRFPDVPKTRADFMLWPAVPGPGKRPVAIYTDGWQWHADRVATDLTKRQSIIRSGHAWVWSLTWSDVEKSANGAGQKQYWDPIGSLPDNLSRLPDGDARLADLRSVTEQDPFTQFLRLVREADPELWSTRAATMATGVFLKSYKAGQNVPAVLDLVEDWQASGHVRPCRTRRPARCSGCCRHHKAAS